MILLSSILLCYFLVEHKMVQFSLKHGNRSCTKYALLRQYKTVEVICFHVEAEKLSFTI